MIWLRNLYDWTLSWAETRFGTWALFVVAIVEASFFIIPPDLLLIALCAGKPKKSYYFVAICSLGSVLGGVIGYGIGWGLLESVGMPILQGLGLENAFDVVGEKYRENAAISIFLAAFTPIPYKVFTIAAGAFGVSLATFLLASICGRSLRFLIVGSALFFFGPKIKSFIDAYFNLITIVFGVLLVGGFLYLGR
ncbi:DedA family protein [bacterium]|jgi:membrane protein YqaA with SNARE-associated domain|nr:DedA family protein [bacterium]